MHKLPRLVPLRQSLRKVPSRKFMSFPRIRYEYGEELLYEYENC